MYTLSNYSGVFILIVPVCTFNRDNSNNVTANPVYANNTDTTKVTQCEEEHIYDVIKLDDKDEKQAAEPKHKMHSNVHQNFPKNTNKNDRLSIKSNELQTRVYCTPNSGNENTVHYSNQSKPKKASKQTAKPVAETQPTIDSPTEDEYILPDIKHTTNNQYAALGETHRAENQYSSLQQDAAYQGLVGQRSLPTEYTIPRTKN